MAPREDPSIASSSEAEDVASDASISNDAIGAAERPTKRRRLSDSSNDSYVAPTSLPSLSRVKKKSQQVAELEPQKAPEEDPVTAKDALALGLNAPESSFETLGLAPWLVGSLSTMEIRRPTAIQRSCIPEVLKGRDCIGGSRTGSGKTVAFAAPILQKWSEDPVGIFALVLTPTR